MTPMTDAQREEIYEIIDQWHADHADMAWDPKPSAPELVKRLREAGYPIVRWADILGAFLKGQE